MRTAAALAMLAMAPSALQGAVPTARTLRVQLWGPVRECSKTYAKGSERLQGVEQLV